MSNYHLFHNDFKRLVLQTHKNWIVWERVNPFPNNKFLDWSRLRAFADKKINVTQKFNFVFRRVENFVGKEENAGYQHFSPFFTMFSKTFIFRVVKSQDYVVKSLRHLLWTINHCQNDNFFL